MSSKIFKPVSLAVLAVVAAGAVLLAMHNHVFRDGYVLGVHDFPSSGLRLLAKRSSGLIRLEVWHGERLIGIIDTDASAYSGYAVSLDKAGDVILDGSDVGDLIFEKIPGAADDLPLTAKYRKKAVSPTGIR